MLIILNIFYVHRISFLPWKAKEAPDDSAVAGASASCSLVLTHFESNDLSGVFKWCSVSLFDPYIRVNKLYIKRSDKFVALYFL